MEGIQDFLHLTLIAPIGFLMQKIVNYSGRMSKLESKVQNLEDNLPAILSKLDSIKEDLDYLKGSYYGNK